jgi:hypothetical protein
LSIPIIFILANYPKTSKFLSKEDRQFVADRVKHDAGRPVKQKLTCKFVRGIVADPRVWALFVPVYTILTDSAGLQWCHGIAGAGLEIFGPTIITSFGYTNVDAVLFQIPIHTASILWGLLLGYISNKTQRRCLIICINDLVGAAGLALAAFDTHKGIRLFGMFLANGGKNGHIYIDLT